MFNFFFLERSNSPIYGTCWHNALNKLKENCDNLDEIERVLLTLRMINCFLDESGHETYDCHEKETDSERRKCMGKMSNRAFTAYSEFYTHTTTTCYYISYEMRQKQSEQALNKLHETSSIMTDKINEANVIQSMMMESQKQALKLQNELYDQGKKLETTIKLSEASVNSMVTKFEETSQKQQLMLSEIFMYIKTFQEWIIGEVSWFQSISYFFITCIICGLFSSSKKTSNARMPLFIILSANVVVERMLVQYCRNLHDDNDLQNTKIHVGQLTWSVRYSAILLCVIILIYYYYKYRDVQYENNRALIRIEEKLNKMDKLNTSNMEIVEKICHSPKYKEEIIIFDDNIRINNKNNHYLTRSCVKRLKN